MRYHSLINPRVHNVFFLYLGKTYTDGVRQRMQSLIDDINMYEDGNVSPLDEASQTLQMILHSVDDNNPAESDEETDCELGMMSDFSEEDILFVL